VPEVVRHAWLVAAAWKMRVRRPLVTRRTTAQLVVPARARYRRLLTRNLALCRRHFRPGRVGDVAYLLGSFYRALQRRASRSGGRHDFLCTGHRPLMVECQDEDTGPCRSLYEETPPRRCTLVLGRDQVAQVSIRWIICHLLPFFTNVVGKRRSIFGARNL